MPMGHAIITSSNRPQFLQSYPQNYPVNNSLLNSVANIDTSNTPLDTSLNAIDSSLPNPLDNCDNFQQMKFTSFSPATPSSVPSQPHSTPNIPSSTPILRRTSSSLTPRDQVLDTISHHAKRLSISSLPTAASKQRMPSTRSQYFRHSKSVSCSGPSRYPISNPILFVDASDVAIERISSTTSSTTYYTNLSSSNGSIATADATIPFNVASNPLNSVIIPDQMSVAAGPPTWQNLNSPQVLTSTQITETDSAKPKTSSSSVLSSASSPSYSSSRRSSMSQVRNIDTPPFSSRPTTSPNPAPINSTTTSSNLPSSVPATEYNNLILNYSPEGTTAIPSHQLNRQAAVSVDFDPVFPNTLPSVVVYNTNSSSQATTASDPFHRVQRANFVSPGPFSSDQRQLPNM